MVRERALPTLNTFEQVEAYLREFSNFGGGPPYDVVGVATLTLALLDNLRENALEVDIENLAETVTDEQAAFIVRFATHMRQRGSR